MADSVQQSEADSTNKAEDTTKEQPEQEAASNGKAASSNGLSQQLEEKIIRQVEVSCATWS